MFPRPASLSALRRSLSAACLALVVLAVAACDDSDEHGDGHDTAHGDTGTLDGDASGDGDVPDGVRPCAASAGEDADGDGILNGLEDRDLDCQVGPDETDWQAADTDGDMIPDGEEDLDRDGLHDEGELDPRSRDTNENGIDDNLEPLAAVCQRSLIPEVTHGAAPTTRMLLAMTSDTFRIETRADGAATFTVDGRIYGYLVRRPTTQSEIMAENGGVLFTLAQAGFPVLVEFQDQAFETWEARHSDPARDLPARPAVRSEVDLGEQGDPLDALRDSLAASLSPVSLSAANPSEAGPRCGADDEVVLWQTTTLEDDGHTVVVGALSCRSYLADPATFFALDDATNTTMLAPAAPPRSYLANGGGCEQTEALVAPTDVDFLWVVDTSGSMADEQQTVATAADLFFATLAGSGSQWRLGVTTTEAWSLDFPDLTPDADLAEHDPGIDLTSGLYGVGFLDGSMPDAIDRFKEYVSVDRNCERHETVGANICGTGLESGLQSGITVLARAEVDERPAYRLREDALTAVIWLSDEEDQHFKQPLGFAPLTGAAHAAQLPAVRDPYLARGVLGCAIVGDQGTGSGGVCTPLPNSASAIVGAQYGKGYIDVAQATGGFWASICNTDLQVTIDNCVRAAFGVARSYPLQGRPLSGTLTVAVDGTVMERSRTAGWSYDAVRNAIVFHGVSLSPGSIIALSYREWRLTEG